MSMHISIQIGGVMHITWYAIKRTLYACKNAVCCWFLVFYSNKRNMLLCGMRYAIKWVAL